MEELGDDHTRVPPGPDKGRTCEIIGDIGNGTRSVGI
ncbi:hypothetical protein SDC9_84801 [bioreactor metagenome]|uniref:Uncharacterized protein n=1 Tax=bioreactor metagenome TaxID=1076179 RepID=A0A644ZK90_9ZZZZ